MHNQGDIMSIKLSEQQEIEVEICHVQRELELQRKPNQTLVNVLGQLRQKHAELNQSRYVTSKAVPA